MKSNKFKIIIITLLFLLVSIKHINAIENKPINTKEIIKIWKLGHILFIDICSTLDWKISHNKNKLDIFIQIKEFKSYDITQFKLKQYIVETKNNFYRLNKYEMKYFDIFLDELTKTVEFVYRDYLPDLNKFYGKPMTTQTFTNIYNEIKNYETKLITSGKRSFRKEVAYKLGLVEENE